jgi:Domain of unknown function (DUF4268)
VFSKEEAKRLRIDFWTAFGVYMRQHLSYMGPKQKWVNYHTGVKGIFFRLEADARLVQVAITLEHDDAGLRSLFFEQFAEMRRYLERETDLDWTWEDACMNADGKPIARISRSMAGVSLYNRADWATMFAFLEAGIVPLDRVWAECSEVFQDLAG